jgi:molybdate transport system ATP-binding protein
VLVLESGRIAEIGSVATVLSAPRSNFGARIAGVNLVNGTIGDHGSLDTPPGDRWHGTPAEQAGEPLLRGGYGAAVFAPTAVSVYRDQPHGSPRNTVELTVQELDTRGSAVLVRGPGQADGAPGLTAEITVDAAAELRLTPGDRVWFSVKAQEVALYPTPHPTLKRQS